MDVYNLTNANTVFNVRTGPARPTSGSTATRPADHHDHTFLSPTQFLAPRIIRFNMTYKFNR